MFEALSEKLNGVFGRLGNKGRLTERDVDDALREVRMALLEADVNFRVAREFVARIRKDALQSDVLKSLSPGQQVVKITNDALVDILGGGAHRLEPGPKQPSVILMVGLNGAGKTTASAKLARHLKQAGRTPLMVAADLQRPAAIEQLQTLGEQVGVEVYQGGTSRATARVAKDGVKCAADMNAAWAIVDTAGRFQIDDELMRELEAVRDAVSPDETLLVVDAMTGQEAVEAAKQFHDRIGADRADNDQDGRGCARRRGAVHHIGYGRAYQVHRHGRALGRAGAVLSGQAGVAHFGNGRYADADRQGAGKLRQGAGGRDGKEDPPADL